MGSLGHQIIISIAFSKNDSVAIHQRNLETLAIEKFKVHNNKAPETMKNAFKIKNYKDDFRRNVRL